MRQIKFRAWDKENKNMLYPKPLSPIKFMLSFSGEFGWFDLDKQMWSGIIPKRYYELMQYTGLKDENGTEIYEGDILEITELSGRIGEYKVGRYTVNFDAGAYVAGSYRLGLVAHRAKVIGNIYENPELLEGEEC